MPDLTRPQLAGYALAAVLVLMLGLRYVHAGAAPESGAGNTSTSTGSGYPAHTATSLSAAPAPAGDAVVDVTGAVRRPGVYRLAGDDRVEAAVRRAGGARADADLAAVNLAAKLTDGAQIVVPVHGSAGGVAGGAPGATGPPAAPVNLNTASAAELDGLDGIGPTTAQKIVEYRQAHGGFGSLQDLDRIPGIGPKRIAALKGKVTT